ncbi:Cysteine synthase [Hondaea fermentalgiana]|uniref:Cysteine synthase n=1 Tax=Hondaea fermentalgiana TaxID=2315210 RepID=A0A2R5GEJ8_9STRA|nr:Cysteine synthase [Hondaea fermentalgiana]|eukprot:GBG26244.1 Cysteine synthase [Hondaea fermentalgiana]
MMLHKAASRGVRVAAQRAVAARGIHASAALSGRLYDNVLQTIGETPIVRINNIAPEGVNVYGKLEYFNPLASVKDRLAFAVIDKAMRRGELKPGDTVVEATSGNTGISLAMVCAARGLNCVITMVETFSVERRKTMRMLGAKVILTPAAEKGTGMVKKAKELAEEHGWFQTRQFDNDDNADYHACTTGPEILSSFADRNLDYFVLGWGTGGTLYGAGRTIKAGSPNTNIVACEPAPAALLTSGQDQERNPDGSAAGSHPAFSAHPIQGWTPDFISRLLAKAQSSGAYDQVMPVDPKRAIETAQLLAKKEGIFCGISGGASMAVALDIAKEAPPGTNICAIVADHAERYLSTPLFADIEADMNAEESEISKSTPNFHL